MIRVLVVDDHPFVRTALAALLATTEDIVVVAECADGSEVLAAVGHSSPDVVLMDVDMPRMDGVQEARALLEAQPDARVLMLSGRMCASTVQRTRSLGVKGYLLKGDPACDLCERVREVAAGGVAWSAVPV